MGVHRPITPPGDPDVERRFREWQQRRMQRESDEVADLGRQVQELKDQLTNPQTGDGNKALKEAVMVTNISRLEIERVRILFHSHPTDHPNRDPLTISGRDHRL